MKFVLLGLSLLIPSTLGHVIQQNEIGILKRVNDPTITEIGATDQESLPAEVSAAGSGFNSCTNYWAGTAPFCNPDQCPKGWHEGGRDSRGDGSKCWSGEKRLCVCDPGLGPVSCNSFWAGTAPFCRGECPVGYKEVGQSNEGNGGFCFSGTKKNCQCTTGTPVNPCTPGPIRTSCLGLVLSCNNGCGKYLCGGCIGFNFGQTTSSAENRDNNFYQTLLTDQNAPLRQALLDTGVALPPDASNENVAETGVRYMDTVADLLETVDTAASYPQWEDPTTWKDTNGQPIILPQPTYIESPTAAATPTRFLQPTPLPQPPNDPTLPYTPPGPVEPIDSPPPPPSGPGLAPPTNDPDNGGGQNPGGPQPLTELQAE